MPRIERRTGLTGTVRFSSVEEMIRTVSGCARRKRADILRSDMDGRGREETKLATTSVGLNSETRRTIGPKGAWPTTN